MTNVFPTSGSLQGGSRVTLTGEGFSSDESLYSISFGHVICDVDSADQNTVMCLTRRHGKTHVITNQGAHPGEKTF